VLRRLTMNDGEHLPLNALADLLAATFPGREDARLALALLAEIARGAPVEIAQLARTTGRDEHDVRALLARWPNLQLDAGDRVVAFGGLSILPTGHRLVIDDRTLYTWCAWDTLFLPALLDQEARVQSVCRETRAAITLTVAPGGVREAQPDDLWVSFPPPEQTSTADITASFCCHVHFLAGADIARGWTSARPGSFALGMDDAFALGRLATRAFFATSGGR
jgi:alkylmercury lyase